MATLRHGDGALIKAIRPYLRLTPQPNK